jgi:hypothetical protein
MPPHRLARHDSTETANNLILEILALSQNRWINKANGPDRSNQYLRVSTETQAAGVISCVDFGNGDDLVGIIEYSKIFTTH